ncbi:IclR family transcriptional regulator (plasmid) [Sphingomonas sp. IC081]|nr:IclR family transcriptional regulator [Sphingomonas sp. IC081]QSR20499.1 hypothetical protein CA833_25595 [Novosphingobium sp. KA1]
MILSRIVSDQAEHNVTALAGELGLPVPTVHRIVAGLAHSGFLSRVARGRYGVGFALRALATEACSTSSLAVLVRPELDDLARRTRRIAHFGIFEGDMVTYLVKAGSNGDRLFTREGMQLEAYCSGIGKILLADLDAADLDRYLSAGPFIALTDTTQTDPGVLRDELERVRQDGFAMDDRSVAPDLTCFAVPVRWPDGRARGAISVSTLAPDTIPHVDGLIARMRKSALAIEHRVFGQAGPRRP